MSKAKEAAKKPAKVEKAAKKVQRRAGKPTTLTVAPTAIDTALAAEVAANMVLNHMVSGTAAGSLERAVSDAFSQMSSLPKPALPKRETSTFKHMKETVANPTSHHLDGLFGVLATSKKRPSLPFGRYPTPAAPSLDKSFGLDAKRTNLPRRKAG
jgi:hypothetical protein